MRLKKDVQVVPFLIRNKIPFVREKNWVTIDETKINDTFQEILLPYKLPDYLETEKRRIKGTGRKPYQKKLKKIKGMDLDLDRVISFAQNIDESTKVKQRPPAIYSNKSYNL